MNDKTRADKEYVPTLSRRESLQWLSAMVAGGAWAAMVGGGAGALAATGTGSSHWPQLDLPPVSADQYGTDPNLVNPERAPWPRTLSPAELSHVALLADVLVPREGDTPSATELHVPDVVDEWVSAPYVPQQRDRLTILSLLQWLDDESQLRFGKTFDAADEGQQLNIIDDIAWLDTAREFALAAAAFDTLRRIVLAAFYCSPEGHADLGYLGGKPIAGDYPGPTPEAQQHLEKVLASLGLESFATH